ncbi:Trehalose utilization [Planctomycetes bacterium CA13]|uniref:Trehalose utilization n=1 Tax=Novipirellula herctigrandis TaxID=2527986 RepID=A0A5C5YXM1_9BACT|nr:Trehalose utilization [Planctomycetes bacterium CA13]
MNSTPIASRIRSLFREFVFGALAFVLFGASSGFFSCVMAEGLEVLFLGDPGRSHQPESRFGELRSVLSGRGIELTYTERVADLNPGTLAQYDVFLLYADIDEISPDQLSALLGYVAGGGGFVPLHCASACFRNAPPFGALVGAEFVRHDSGVFRALIDKPDHEVMKGYAGFESWDETYVHDQFNEKNRTILEYRVDQEGREPWTWIRTHGKGRVFYTASGHDQRTWTHPGFQNLVERGIRWAAGEDPQDAGVYVADAPFPIPEMNSLANDLKPFEYVDVGRELPVYNSASEFASLDERQSTMQQALPAEESIKHLVVPKGFHVELFASEPDLHGKPICMAWDASGRLWVAETEDYPNELHEDGFGNDRIRICEDTDKDGRADKFTLFADNLSIPSAIAFSRGGAIVQNGTQTLFLQDTNGDGRADVRSVLVSNWNMEDTHAGVSNFQYGHDNWIWGTQGYNYSQPIANGEPQESFRMGFFRMRPDGSEIEFIRSTNNNTWGLGFSEEGLVFGSTANGNPSVYMPIANRYYERVRGWMPSLTLSSIADTSDFSPITDKVRQVDWQGGYTSATGHALYTARAYPEEYWNRVAFVNGPTGHLSGAFVLKQRGSDFRSTNPFNLLASDDEWTSPTMAEVGPDGQVWVIDWYNYILQHNRAAEGFEEGKGRAYETTLRDKELARIYRVVADPLHAPNRINDSSKVPDLERATVKQRVASLAHPTMLVRKHAQRLLVERGVRDITDSLIDLVDNHTTDAIGLNVGAIHALWTLHGLGLLDGSHDASNRAVYRALKHPSAGVRRVAAQVLPTRTQSVAEIFNSNLLRDPNRVVRLAALLALSDLASSEATKAADGRMARDRAGEELMGMMLSHTDMTDRWIPDALTSAAAQYSSSVLRSLANQTKLPEAALEIIRRVAEHHAHGDDANDQALLLANLNAVDPPILSAVIDGFLAASGHESAVKLDVMTDVKLLSILDRIPAGSRGGLIKLATGWGSNKFSRYGQELIDGMLRTVHDQTMPDEQRIAAAVKAIDFVSSDREVVVSLLDEVTPRTSPSVAIGLINALEGCRWDGLGDELIGRLGALTPSVKQAAFSLMLKRPPLTMVMLRAAIEGDILLDTLTLEQQQALIAHPDETIRQLAERLLNLEGTLPTYDRKIVLDRYQMSTQHSGDRMKGQRVFMDECAKCHVHGELGVRIGPDLTGMALSPKSELLIHILDPSRTVEGNFRTYTVLTDDGMVLTGMLQSESKTAIELVDSAGVKQNVLREGIEEWVMSPKSLMPEGYEGSISVDGMTDLLEFLTFKSRYVPISIGRYANAISTKGLFHDDGPDRFVFPDWGPKQFNGVPFQLADPHGESRPNLILLHSPNGPLASRMPKEVSLPCNAGAKAIHLLSGVAGWGYPFDTEPTVSMIVRFRYADGRSEDHELLNGVHFADYVRRNDVPESEFAFGFPQGQQLRYLKIEPKRSEKIETIDFIKGTDQSAPVVMAVTIEPSSSSP